MRTRSVGWPVAESRGEGTGGWVGRGGGRGRGLREGLDYKHKSVNLVKREQFSQEFLNINPMGYVPAIVDGDIVLADSFAILLYLEETYPQHPLIPCDSAKRIVNYHAASIVTSSMQPLLRMPVQFYIEEKVGQDEKISWVHYYLGKCLAGYLQQHNFDMSEFPLLCRLGEAYIKVPAIENAIPEKQPDFPIN
nr:glutathione S-transferase zeta class-like [Tanacetum cinerariifolium]